MRVATAVEATRRGAYDFLEKPLDTDRILLVLRNALQQRGLLEENARLKGEVQSRHEIVGRSFAIRQVLERLERVAPTDVTRTPAAATWARRAGSRCQTFGKNHSTSIFISSISWVKR